MPAASYTAAAMNHPARLSALALACAALLSGCGKKDADVTAEAEKALPAEEQMPAPAADEPAAQTLPDEATSNANFEAWFKKHGLDLADPAMLDADADGDGFSNRDEFLADSNPKDPESRPGIHSTIRLKEYTEVRLPFVVREVAGEVATIEFQGDGAPAREKVRKGDAIRGTKLKIDRVETRLDTDKHGERVDMSQIVMTDGDTGDRVVALKDLPTRTSASFATLTDADGKTTLKVREGEVFSWPSEPGVSYKVIDLRMDQVVVKDEASGKTVTIPRP
jgi:hypothetical protein